MRWLKALLGIAPPERPARGLYEAAIALARRPEWYIRGRTPDTVDGRFDVLALVLSLVLRRLDQLEAAGPLTRSLLECFIDDMDSSLREMGVGDLSVGKQVKAMVDGLNGRRLAYDAALDGADALADALRRNLFRGADLPPDTLGWLAGRVQALEQLLGRMDLAMLAAGPVLAVEMGEGA